MVQVSLKVMNNMNSKEEKHRNVAIVLFPWASKAPYNFVSDILKILNPITNDLYLITSNLNRLTYSNSKLNNMDIKLSVHYVKDKKPLFFSYLCWIIKSMLIQIVISIYIIKIRKETDIIIFMAYPFYSLPLIISKILGNKNIELITRSKRNIKNKFVSKFFDLNENFAFRFLDGISPESDTIIDELNLHKYQEKLLPNCSRYVNISSNITNINKRNNVVGFIGRLIKEKGIIEFIKSISLIIKEKKDVEFIIGGDGDLSYWVENEIKNIKEVYGVKISFVGWIPNEEMHNYLNKLKVLVLPSYTEGLPTIILESIANGTPVLASNVGGIPDIIKKETGFILDEISPESIKNRVIEIFEHPNLDKITLNAIDVIEKNNSYEKAVERYDSIIKKVL